MRISLNWLKDYVDLHVAPAELAHRLTMAGLEVSAIENVGEGIEGVVVGQILERGPHPNADRLSLCRVSDGAEEHEIVCGATNMAAGDKVALARVGTRLPGNFKIKKAKIRGQLSFGMMCSERELGLGDDHGGIMILPADSPLGEPVAGLLGVPDTIFEVDLTPNRADCLSVVGVAREVAAVTGAELRIPEPRLEETGEPIDTQTSVEIEAPDLCHRYAARLIKGVALGPSPSWLRQRLQSAGVRALNNVVDVTNYVLMELGHPLHAFDFGRLAEGRIVVRRAGAGEKFTTLDDQERSLDPDTLMICDGSGSVAVAGIMGGQNSEVQEDTVDILLESAYFLPENTRRSAKRLGLSTEASYRFERGTDIDGLIRALDRAAALIVELAGGTISRGIWDAYPTLHPAQRVACRPAKVASVLGVPMDAAELVGLLKPLGLCKLEEDQEQVVFQVPTHRVDLEREIDLIEEAARIRGYDSIPTTLPQVSMSGAEAPASMRIADQARDLLAAAGMREAVCLSFIDPAEDERMAYAADEPLRSKVRLQNPLNTETEVMRSSLLPGLLRAAGLNTRRQTGVVRLFEVGRTFHPEGGVPLPREVLRVAGVLSGQRSPTGWWGAEGNLDFFDCKGLLESFLERLGVFAVRYEALSGVAWLHPGQGARLLREGADLGWCGRLHPDRAAAYEVAEETYAFELDLQRLMELREDCGSFAGLDRYPAVERDVALVVDATTPAQRLLDAVSEHGAELIRSTTVFDIYRGEHLPEGKMSIALRVVYRSDERTLTEAEVQQAEAALLDHLSAQVGAHLRQG